MPTDGRPGRPPYCRVFPVSGTTEAKRGALMSLHVCRIPGCPTLTPSRLCPTHQAEHEKRRGTPTARGYDAAHFAERARIKRNGIESYRCARCGGAFLPGEAFDLGHTDDRRGWSGPEHQRCNRGDAGSASHRIFEASSEPFTDRL